MGENKQERFGTGSGVPANPDGGSAGVRAEAGPGDRSGGAGGAAAERSRPPDRGGHPGGADPMVSLATGVSPATAEARDRDLEARRESGVSAGSDGKEPGAAGALRRHGEGIGAETRPSGEAAAGSLNEEQMRPDAQAPADSPGEVADLAEPRRSMRRRAGAPRSTKPVASLREERRPAGAVDVAVEDIDTFVVDCDRCAVRGAACADCVVSVLLGPPVGLVWDADERRAVDALAEAGMVPRLRLVPETDSRSA